MCQHDGEDGDLPVGARFCSGWHPVCRMAIPRIVFHCCNQGVEAQAARTGTVGVADRLPLSFREIRYDLGLERRLPASERISSWFSFSKICSNK